MNSEPVFSRRHFTPIRTFVTKWDVEIDRNRSKKISRNRDRDSKYFDHFDYELDHFTQIVHAQWLDVLKRVSTPAQVLQDNQDYCEPPLKRARI